MTTQLSLLNDSAQRKRKRFAAFFLACAKIAWQMNQEKFPDDATENERTGSCHMLLYRMAAKEYFTESVFSKTSGAKLKDPIYAAENCNRLLNDDLTREQTIESNPNGGAIRFASDVVVAIGGYHPQISKALAICLASRWLSINTPDGVEKFNQNHWQNPHVSEMYKQVISQKALVAN